MFRHYASIAFRHLYKQKSYSGINIIGLSVALACAVVICTFVAHEYSFDRFFAHNDRIVRIIETQHYPTGDLHVAVTPFPLGPALQRDHSEIAASVRLFYGNDLILSRENSRFYQAPLYADSTFFQVFSYELAAGDPTTALGRTNSVVLAPETATKLFGEQNPMGQTIRVDAKYDLTVTGLLAPVPRNSHLNFAMLVSMPTISDTWTPQDRENWGRNAFSTYVLLQPHVDLGSLAAQLANQLESYRNGDKTTTLKFQPLSDIHLNPSLVADNSVTTDPHRLFMFIVAAALVLLIAGLNFVNLATVQAYLRAKELGLRSCLGANLGQLRRQILSETAFTIGAGSLVAIVLVELGFPLIKRALGTNLVRSDFFSFQTAGLVVTMWLIASLLIGCYLAYAVVRRTPATLLKDNRLQRSRIRAVLVVLQFVVSIVMILVTFSIMRQQQFSRQTSLSQRGDQVLVIPLRGTEAHAKAATLRQALSTLTGVRAVSACGQLPNRIQSSSTYAFEGQPPDMEFLFDEDAVDDHFLDCFDIKLLEGRNIRENETNVCLLNATAVRQIGWTSPLGKTIDLGDTQKATVIGVVEDFHYSSLRDKIGPLLLYPGTTPQDITVRIQAAAVAETSQQIERAFSAICPGTPYNAVFFDQTFDRMYREELQIQRTVSLFAAIAIILACLGLYGLAAFSIQRRTKEVGVRKVFGASIKDIVTLHTGEYLLWLTIANVIGWPVGYLLSQQWLARFAYRTTVPFWLFAAVAAGTLLLVICTVAIQTIRAALANPVDALRYE